MFHHRRLGQVKVLGAQRKKGRISTQGSRCSRQHKMSLCKTTTSAVDNPCATWGQRLQRKNQRNQPARDIDQAEKGGEISSVRKVDLAASEPEEEGRSCTSELDSRRHWPAAARTRPRQSPKVGKCLKTAPMIAIGMDDILQCLPEWTTRSGNESPSPFQPWQSGRDSRSPETSTGR
jgi:hypothetical protein